MKRFLIVNADDCNLTRGVTEAILDCHDNGSLTSTTFMINLPLDSRPIREIKKRKGLGVGLHLNVTLSHPVSKSAKVRSLVDSEGGFRKVAKQFARPPVARELALEYQNQIEKFRKVFGRNPTHLDTHHQVHDAEFFYRVLLEVARRNRLPIRRSRLMLSSRFRPGSVPTTDFIFGNLTAEGYWRRERLLAITDHLPAGTSEIMCHPGRVDRDLRKISSFTTGRGEEWKIFSSAEIRRHLERAGIELTHFGVCYNRTK